MPITVLGVEPYSALYKLEADGMPVGKLERTLGRAAEDGSFILKSKTYTTGFLSIFVKDRINEESQFRISGGKVVPLSYHYLKKKKGKLIEERITFNSTSGYILSNFNDGKQEFPIIGNESDKLLYQYRIREALRRGETDLQYQVVDRMNLRPYLFKVGALEKLETEVGALEVVRVERINEGKRKTTLWFAPSLDYLPVKIEQDADDHKFSSTIISITLRK